MRLLVFNLATDAEDPILGFTTAWLGALATRVEAIDVITMRAGKLRLPSNVNVYSLGKECGYSEVHRLARFYVTLIQLVRTHAYLGCFSHMNPKFTVLAAPVLKARRVPIITWYAHPHAGVVLKAAHWLSDRMVSSLPTTYPYRRDKLIVIGQGIDTGVFQPAAQEADDSPMLLSVGRLSPVKDQLTFIEAVGVLRDRVKPFEAVLLGSAASSRDASYETSLRMRVESLGLQTVLRFVDAVSFLELPQWYGRARATVNLTGLGFGDKVALEAMSMGRPCFVANPGFHDTLGIYREQLAFTRGDARSLADKIFALWTLPRGERLRIGSYLRRRVEAMHGLDNLAQTVVNLFRDVRRGTVSGCRTKPGVAG
jgi:glycosyltransferase involved in cell wall biosynthesis